MDGSGAVAFPWRSAALAANEPLSERVLPGASPSMPFSMVNAQYSTILSKCQRLRRGLVVEFPAFDLGQQGFRHRRVLAFIVFVAVVNGAVVGEEKDTSLILAIVDLALTVLLSVLMHL